MSKYVRDNAHCKHGAYTKEEVNTLVDEKVEEKAEEVKQYAKEYADTITQPEAITGKGTVEHKIAVENSYEKLAIAEYNKVGSNLSISDGKLVIGEGINKIFVEYNANYYSSVTGAKYVSLFKNGSTTDVAIANKISGTTKENTMIAQTRVILDVVEGDYFELKAYGSAGDILDATKLFITVEKIC